MKLTHYEQSMLEGKCGAVIQQAMELLVGMGKCFDAPFMVPITSVLLVASDPAGTGKAGSKFIKELAESGAKFLVPTISDIACLDVEHWEIMGFDKEIHRQQIELSAAIAKMGGLLKYTCAPYHIGHIPGIGEHVAWGESSAVIFANAVLGVRTNQEGGFTGLASALTGRTPAYGYHLDENRRATVRFNVIAPLNSDFDYSTLGYYAGKIAEDRVPLFSGIPANPSWDQLIFLGAGLATSGNVAHYQIPGITPESPVHVKSIRDSDTHNFGQDDLQKTVESLCSAGQEEIDLAVLGCPHLSILQIEAIARLLEGRKLKPGIDLWLLASSVIKRHAAEKGYAKTIEASGARFVCGTCPAGMPVGFVWAKGFRVIASDSAKLINYCRENQSLKSYFNTAENIIEAVTKKI